MNQTRQILIDGDIDGYRQYLAPRLDRAKAEIAMHVARTMANSVPEKLRLYSHFWLKDRSLPSMLPNDLLPKAIKLEPIITEAVAISVKPSSAYNIPLATAVRHAMQDAVLEMYDDKVTDPATIKARMMEARDKVRRQ